jgi:Tfp pilus assembly protein PilX
MKRKRGQILVLVLLVVVVALAVGLSVASRNITNLRTSTQTEQSQRAFTAAEGGVEDVLSRLSTVPVGTNISVPVGDITAIVNVAANNTYNATIEEGTAGQISLSGATGTQVQIEWGKTGDSLEDPNPASIEVTQVFGVGSSYDQTRSVWMGADNRLPNESGFTSPNCLPSSGYKLCTRIDLPLAPNIPLFLRIRPLWTKATVQVTSVNGTLPVQTYDVTSTATTTLGVTRKVQVSRTALPVLPAAFDYVLFSEQGIVK